MSIYTGEEINTLASDSLDCARKKLSEIPAYCGPEAAFSGLRGWVFEQTIQHCLQAELEHNGFAPEISTQVPIGGRAKADLGLGKLLIEIKSRGLFGMGDVARYQRYRSTAESKGRRYLFLTLGESYLPYQQSIIKALGTKNTFFLLDQNGRGTGDWERFVDRVCCEM